MQVGKKIAAARKLKGLTQEELADLSQITVRTIQRIEAGNNTPQSFTLKAIAKALELDYADLLTNTNTVAAGNNGTAADMRHFMTLLNFSCFTYVVIPWVHWLIPMQVLKRRNDISGEALGFAQQIIRRQIYWTVAINLAMLGTLAYNYTVVSVMGNKNAVIPYLWPFLLLYFINATVILVQHSTIRMRF